MSLYAIGTYSEQLDESCLLKVMVRGKSLLDLLPGHNDKTGAVRHPPILVETLAVK
jgi:hypothetical protein